MAWPCACAVTRIAARRLAGLGCVLGLAAAGANPADVERGRRLFQGELPLAGRVNGHSADLPPQASRCVNCHAAGTALPAPSKRPAPSPSAPAGAASTPSFGPALDATLLLRDVRRRGGPPSRYDEAALCKLLSTGIDPAYVIIPRNMPRYELTATDCHALWTYLIRPRP